MPATHVWTVAVVLAVGAWTPDAGVQTARSATPPLAGDAVTKVATAVSRSVVFLHTVGSDPSDAGPMEGLGSGVVIGAGGLILTSAHVVQGAARVHVRTEAGEDLDTSVIARDPDSDLALLRASDSTDLIPATLGDSDRLRVGAFVIAVGSPYGLHHTVTMGILSAKARGMDDSGLEFLQTDAAINPGNSGGGLFDLEGRLVGITSTILTPPGSGNTGLNFAIPVNVARALLPQLRQGRVRHGWIGVSARGLSGRAAVARGLPQGTTAMEIIALAPDGPAAQAGLRVGDLLLSGFLGRVIPVIRIHEAVWLASPGTQVDLTFRREGRSETVRVTLGSRPPS